jgi:hypothetical protein
VVGLLAPRDEAPGVDGDRRAGRVKGGARTSGRRSNKPNVGKDGPASKGSKGSSKGSKGGSIECATLSIRINTGDIMDNAIDTPYGYATKFDMYTAGSRPVIGSWYEQASYVNQGGTDGIGTGMLVWSDGESSISFSGAL